jgi:hypothetical protein
VDWAESDYSERTAMRFARAGALVRVVAAESACEVCRAKAGRNYAPAEVPRLPIRGCRNERCRCRFEAVDPETELTVSQLVERGIHALRAGRRDLARQVLRRAVTLDEMHELGWLWLSGVLEDSEKVVCLEKVLAINPRNKHARSGLELLHEKIGASSAGSESVLPEPAKVVSAPEPIVEPTEPVAGALPPELDTVREERSVIVEQWTEFVVFAVELDPAMLLMQATAFLQKLQRLNQQALQVLSETQAPQKVVLDELYLQWQDSEKIGASLADVIEAHRSDGGRSARQQPAQNALHKLAQQVLDHRDVLRDRIATTGGKVPG